MVLIIVGVVILISIAVFMCSLIITHVMNRRAKTDEAMYNELLKVNLDKLVMFKDDEGVEFYEKFKSYSPSIRRKAWFNVGMECDTLSCAMVGVGSLWVENCKTGLSKYIKSVCILDQIKAIGDDRSKVKNARIKLIEHMERWENAEQNYAG